MNIADIQTLYAYNRWANERLFAALGELSDDEFVALVPSSFPSVRETVFHLLLAEWLWLKRWQGESPRSTADSDVSHATRHTSSPGGMPTARELATLGALKSFAESIEQERNEFLRGLTEDVLQAPLQFSDMSGKPYAEPLVHLMQHLVNHSTYHRGQVTTLLRQLGEEGVPLDMLFFFRDDW